MEVRKPVRSYKDLDVWHKAMDLTQQVYAATQSWPKEELYGLTSQLRRCIVSVPSNIAEGQGRTSTNEFRHHLSIARGSLFEAETQILIARRLGYLAPDVAERLLDLAGEVSRMISRLYQRLPGSSVDH